MSVNSLDKIFRPSSVAVIGASEKEGTVGYAFLHNLLSGGFEGRIYPVNPRYKALAGLPCFSSVRKIGEPIDLAVVATHISTVPDHITECAAAGAAGVIVVSAGGKEAGREGEAIEARIKASAEASGIRILGPNCLGLVNTEVKLNATFAAEMPLPGRLAFVSQSGAICTAILDLSLKERNGFSVFVSIGSMLDVDFGDLINYLGGEPQVSSILLYIESLSNFRKFMSAARAVSRVKPIVVLKAGRSAAGAKAAASHTGALAGADAVYDAAFERAGIVRVHTIQELFDCAEIMAKGARPAGSGIAVITNAGGPGVMAADELARWGLEPVTLRPEAIERLDQILPPFWSRNNPIDILGDASPQRYLDVVEACLSAPEIQSVVIIMTPQAMSDPTGVARSLSERLKGRKCSVYTVWMGGMLMESARKVFNEAGIPTYDTPERAIRALKTMVAYVRNLEMLQQIPKKLPHDPEFDRGSARRIIDAVLERGDHLLTEVESKAILKAYGIPVIPTEAAASADEAVAKAGAMGYPVVLKILSRDISHKSDAGGVELNLRSADDVRQAFGEIMARARAFNPNAELAGVTVQPMLPRQDYELIIGSKRDPHFGPVILFGMGGIMTEILKDRALALPPLNRLLARRLMEGTRVFRLLRGYRNRPPANLELLEEILIRLSQIVTDFPEITELDMNPVLAVGSRVAAVDARVLVESASVPSPRHLVISPYPGHQELRTVTKGGLDLFIRPIRPEDAPLLVDFFNTLSPRSVYFRFFRPLRELSHDMLVRFTQIDYDRDIVLVAIRDTDEGERMLGVARLMGDPDVTRAEFAVVVGDPWQGKGVGAALLERCITIARERGIEFIWGVVLPENTTMLTLGRKLGFSVSRIPESCDFELRIDLADPRVTG